MIYKKYATIWFYEVMSEHKDEHHQGQEKLDENGRYWQGAILGIKKASLTTSASDASLERVLRTCMRAVA